MIGTFVTFLHNMKLLIYILSIPRQILMFFYATFSFKFLHEKLLNIIFVMHQMILPFPLFFFLRYFKLTLYAKKPANGMSEEYLRNMTKRFSRTFTFMSRIFSNNIFIPVITFNLTSLQLFISRCLHSLVHVQNT